MKVKEHKRCYTYVMGTTPDYQLLTCRICGEMFQIDDCISGFSGGRIKAWGEVNRQLGKKGEKAGLDTDGHTLIRILP